MKFLIIVLFLCGLEAARGFGQVATAISLERARRAGYGGVTRAKEEVSVQSPLDHLLARSRRAGYGSPTHVKEEVSVQSPFDHLLARSRRAGYGSPTHVKEETFVMLAAQPSQHFQADMNAQELLLAVVGSALF